MEVYLDNSATTRCYEGAAKLMYEIMTEHYGNPSSLHNKGVDAEKYVREAVKLIARNLKVEEKELYFTSGGTESDNLALMGCARANRRAGNHLITTCFEHPAVLNTMKELEEEGFRVTYLPVDERGVVRLSDLEEALCDETILVSVMYVNNEIDYRARIARERRFDIYFVGRRRIIGIKIGIILEIHVVYGHFRYARHRFRVRSVADSARNRSTVRVDGVLESSRAVVAYENISVLIVIITEIRVAALVERHLFAGIKSHFAFESVETVIVIGLTARNALRVGKNVRAYGAQRYRRHGGARKQNGA